MARNGSAVSGKLDVAVRWVHNPDFALTVGRAVPRVVVCGGIHKAWLSKTLQKETSSLSLSLDASLQRGSLSLSDDDVDESLGLKNSSV